MAQDSKMAFQKEGIWPTLVSVLAPLIQIVAVFSLGLSKSFNMSIFFLFPGTLNLINFFSILLILAGVGFYWFWRNNFRYEMKKNRKGEQVLITLEKATGKALKFLLFFSLLSFMIFVFSVVSVNAGIIFISVFIFALVQYLSYSFVLCFSGLIIYIWIYEYIMKKQTFQREDFIKNLINTLTEHGIVKPQEVQIYKNQIEQYNRIVEIKVDYNQYEVRASFDGKEIMEIKEKERQGSLNLLDRIVNEKEEVKEESENEKTA